MTNVSERRAHHLTMTIAPPKNGDGVSIISPHAARLRGHVAGRRNGSLTIELEHTSIRRPFHFAAGSAVDVEWIDPLGLMQVSATVESAREDPCPALEVELVGEPEPVERREHDRVPVELEVSGWTLTQPTTRLVGHTVNISPRGAHLSLPELSPFAATVELLLALPGAPLRAGAVVRWRRDAGIVGVEFAQISPEDRARLVDFLRAP